MKANYSDIIDRIDIKPTWYNEAGVPRYCDFHPTEVADIHANEAALILIRCQQCGTRFHVAVSSNRMKAAMTKGAQTIQARITTRSLEYGDPPNTPCCDSGPTMNSIPERVLEYWRRSPSKSWERFEDMEEEILPEWAT